MKNDPREPLRIASGHRVVGQRRRHHRHAERGLVRQKRGSPFGRVRQLVLRLAVGGHLLRASGVDAGTGARGGLPDAGNVAPRCGRRLHILEVEIVHRSRLPDLALTERRARRAEDGRDRAGHTDDTHQRHETLLHDRAPSLFR